MHINKYCIFFILLFLSCFAKGQTKQYTLNGSIHVKNGKIYPYKMVFGVKAGVLKGTATTKLDDGSEPCTNISGSINRKQRSLSFKELYPETAPKIPITCFVNAMLYYKTLGNRLMLTGDFKGRDYEEMYCGEGSLEFEEQPALKELFGIDSAAYQQQQLQLQQQYHSKWGQTADTPQRQIVYEKGGVYEITAGVNKQFQWRTDTCIIDVFDGGAIDGDEITLMFNDKEVLPRYTLAKKKKQIKLYLDRKANTLTIVAEREGKITPNTADMLLTDGSRHYKIKAYNTIGESASITIYKK